MKVYLAGPITGLDYAGATDWRNAFRDQLRDIGIVGKSPMRGKDYLLRETNIADAYPQTALSSEQGIVGRDLFDVRTCDVTLCNFLGAERVSIGTVMELAVAFENKKYVLVVMEPENVHNHSFVRRFASSVVTTLEEAYHILAIIDSE